MASDVFNNIVDDLSSEGVSRPEVTSNMLDEAENFLNNKIPDGYRNFLLNHGTKVIIGLDLAVPHDGEKSSLVEWAKLFEEKSLSTDYFPFCKSDNYFYCLERNKGTVHLWNQFENAFENQTWDTFMTWLQSFQ